MATCRQKRPRCIQAASSKHSTYTLWNLVPAVLVAFSSCHCTDTVVSLPKKMLLDHQCWVANSVSWLSAVLKHTVRRGGTCVCVDTQRSTRQV